MSVIKVKIQKDFTVLYNGVLENPRLSFKAKGLWAYCMSRPDNWQFHVQHLATVSKDGVDAIYSALKELEAEGLVEKTQKNENGRFGSVDYVIYPYPAELKKFLPHRDFPETENPQTENPALTRTEEENKKGFSSSSSSLISPQVSGGEVSKEEMRRTMRNAISSTDEEFEEAWSRWSFLEHENIDHPKAWFKTVIENMRKREIKQINHDNFEEKRTREIVHRKIAEQKERLYPRSANPERYVACLQEEVLLVSGEHQKRVRYDLKKEEWEELLGWV